MHDRLSFRAEPIASSRVMWFAIVLARREAEICRGYPDDFAERLFRQIESVGEYGFPESHAAFGRERAPAG